MITLRGRLACGIGALVLLGSQALHPGPLEARTRTFSPQSLTAKITKMFPWATPKLIARTVDGRQFSLSIYQKGNPANLDQGVGARLVNLYMTELKGQPIYYLTTYSVPQGGAAVWQYVYTPATKQLVRRHFITAKPTQVAFWYITPSGIANAAKVGHWPAPAKAPSH